MAESRESGSVRENRSVDVGVLLAFGGGIHPGEGPGRWRHREEVVGRAARGVGVPEQRHTPLDGFGGMRFPRGTRRTRALSH